MNFRTQGLEALRTETAGGTMFRCERCGSAFTPSEAKGLEGCPTCQERDGVRSPLAFKLFDGVAPGPTALERVRQAARGLRRPARAGRPEGR
jgi:predicted  nucleic acid-binding Zn-ribbon protein